MNWFDNHWNIQIQRIKISSNTFVLNPKGRKIFYFYKDETEILFFFIFE